jgi:hypothetical protein
VDTVAYVNEINMHQYAVDMSRFAPTQPRFNFDAFCTKQLLLVRDRDTSGAVSWIYQPNESANVAYSLQTNYVWQDLWCHKPVGALAVDADSLFADIKHHVPNTQLAPSKRALWQDYFDQFYRTLYFDLTDLYTVHAAPKVTLKPALPLAVSTFPPVAVAPPQRELAVTTPYADVLGNLKRIGPWSSWKKLAPLLNTSHTQLGRIAAGEVAVPANDLARNIDEMHRFALRVDRLTSGDATVMTRLLASPRERDNMSAMDFLNRQDYRSAFSAVMEAASPKPLLAAVEPKSLRWYNEPSRDLYDTEVASDD